MWECGAPYLISRVGTQGCGCTGWVLVHYSHSMLQPLYATLSFVFKPLGNNSTPAWVSYSWFELTHIDTSASVAYCSASTNHQWQTCVTVKAASCDYLINATTFILLDFVFEPKSTTSIDYNVITPLSNRRVYTKTCGSQTSGLLKDPRHSTEVPSNVPDRKSVTPLSFLLTLLKCKVC